MRFEVAIVLAVLVRATAYSAAAGSLDDVLARMDRAAPVFKGFSADLTSVTHTAVIDEDETEQGRDVRGLGRSDHGPREPTASIASRSFEEPRRPG